MSAELEEQPSKCLWMEDKLRDMEMIMDENFEINGELNDFLTESYSPPKNNSSLLSNASWSSPSSYETSFHDNLTKPVPASDTNVEGNDSLSEVKEKMIMEEVTNCSKKNTTTDLIEAVASDLSKPKLSRLPTPSKQLGSYTFSSSSPVKDSQLEYLREMRDCDITKLIQPGLSTNQPESQSPSESSSNDTYIVTSCSSEEKVPEAPNDSGASEASSLGSTVSTESVIGDKKTFRKLRSGPPANRKALAGTKLTKPATKPSLLPSKRQNKICVPTQSNKHLHQPLIKLSAPTVNKLFRPSNPPRKITSLKNQENQGVPQVPTNAPSKLSKRQPPKKTRIRKSSIPKPVAVSELGKKNQRTTQEVARVKPRVKKSVSVPVIQSTPISDKTQLHIDTTPSRRRPAAVENSPGAETGSIQRPSFGVDSLSSIEGSEHTKKSEAEPTSEAGTVKTPRTVTKRRSLIPTPGGRDLHIPPFDLETECTKVPNAQQQEVSASPYLNNKTLPPRKKSLKPQIKSSGLQKPRAGSGRMVFKPRNGNVPRVKERSVKPMTAGYVDESEMLPKFGAAKVVHSPLNKENVPGTPHSEWSPIRKKKNFNPDDAIFMCTKRIVH